MTEIIIDKQRGSNPVTPARSLIQGFKMLLTPELRKYLIVPVLFNLWLFGSLFYIGAYYFGWMIEQFLPAWLDWLTWILWPLFYLGLSVMFYFTFTLIANLIGAPFYGRLAKKTLLIITDNTDLIDEVPVSRVFLGETKRFVFLICWTIPLLFLFIIPVVNLIAPILWALFGAWGMALEFMGYPMENEGLAFSEQRSTLKAMPLGAFAFGGLIMLGLMIPFFNILIPPSAVIGATIYLQEVKD